ncbi:hypothetical protein EQV77_14915 [Halobacillus fulvus]|nr:hypothetical protein EQV77_14915 [Halobacillus fulvus]
MDTGSPKSVQSCREVNLLEDEETVLALEMVNDCNLTVHTYNEEVAIKILNNLPKYHNLLHQWDERMNDNVRGRQKSENSDVNLSVCFFIMCDFTAYCIYLPVR